MYGLLNVSHAQQIGYHNYGTEPAIEAQYSQETHSADYYNVIAAKSGGGEYNGQAIPTGGCIGQAEREVEGTVDFDLPSQLVFTSGTAANIDSRVEAGYAAWSTCLKEVGYSYATPMDANNDSQWGGYTASKAEIAVAVEDVRCKKETNLVGIRMAVESAYQQVAIAAHATELRALKDQLARQIITANTILSSEG